MCTCPANTETMSGFTVLPYRRKFSGIGVGLTSAKILSANEVFVLFYQVTVASIHKNFIYEFSFLEPSTKILSLKDFPLYSMRTKHNLVYLDYCSTHMGTSSSGWLLGNYNCTYTPGFVLGRVEHKMQYIIM